MRDRLIIGPDDAAADPSEGAGWRLVSFNPRHATFGRRDDYQLYREPARRDSARGLVHRLSHFCDEDGGERWELLVEPVAAKVGETPTVDGLLLWPWPEALLALRSGHSDGFESARAFLEEYNGWFNFRLYRYRVVDARGKTVDTGGGHLSASAALRAARGYHPDAVLREVVPGHPDGDGLTPEEIDG